MSVLAWGPRQQDSLLALQKYDICHRLELLLYKGTGSFPIFAETVELLTEFYTPAFERIPPPEADQESFVICGRLRASSLCAPGPKNTIRSKWPTASGRSVLLPDPMWARIQLPDEGETGFIWCACGAGMTCTGLMGIWYLLGTILTHGSFRPKR